MTATLESILLAGALGVRPFPQNSRYHSIATTTLELRDGTTVVYLKRRFIPSPDTMTLMREHVVQGGDRLDKLAAQFLGDPELFWRICDANAAMQPQDLTQTAGDKILIAMPAEIPGGRGG